MILCVLAPSLFLLHILPISYILQAVQYIKPKGGRAKARPYRLLEGVPVAKQNISSSDDEEE
ncbi:MAG: hypothetical protein ACYDER_17645 [Ktedonobacteraceae bacterium]